jgi:hypothetical protein
MEKCMGRLILTATVAAFVLAFVMTYLIVLVTR